MTKQKRPVRILWNAKDSPTVASGYGMVGKHLLPRFADRYGKENVVAMAPVFTRDRTEMWNGLKILPGLADWGYGEEMVLSHWDNVKPTFLLMVGDWFMLRTVPQLAAQDRVLWVQYAPYDFLRVPDHLIQSTVKYAWRVVPWSVYAREKFLAHKLTNVTDVIPLGVDANLWRPLDRRDFPKVMRSIGFTEESYNILIVGANQRRKYWFEQLEGVSVFHKAHPEIPIRLYFHTHVQAGGDLDLDDAIRECGLQDLWRTPDQYTLAVGGFTEEQLVLIMNCADVVLNAALEGFGLVQAQAQSVGVPVITLSEGPGTEIVAFGAQIRMMAPDYTAPLLRAIPSPVDLAAALEEMYPLRGKRSQAAIDHIRKNFSWDVVAEKWFTLIENTLMPERESHSLYIPQQTSSFLQRRARRIVEVPASQ